MASRICTILLFASLVAPAFGAGSQLALTYLGTAGWQLTDGKIVILVDPYLSRIPLLSDTSRLRQAENAGRPVVDESMVVKPDTAVVDAHVQHADFILLTHSHVDHILDAPYIALKTGATVIGHESAINVMRASGVPAGKLITVRGGEDYTFGSFSVRIVPSIHSPLFNKHYFQSGIIPPSVQPPFKLGDLIDGGSLAYLIRIAGHQILAFGSMNYIEREVAGLRPDVVLMGAGESRKEIYDYAGRLMRALGFPANILPTHWDNYFVPFAAPQDESIGKLQDFVNEVRAVSPKTQVIIPKYFEAVPIPLHRN